MPSGSQYQTKRFTINSSTFTNIVAPIECATLIITNSESGVAMTVRSDPADSETEKTLPADAEGEIRASLSCFAAGATVCAIKAASGTGPAIVSFVR